MNYAADRREGIENFPDSYKPYLYELQKKHPNWNFKAVRTNIDFDIVLVYYFESRHYNPTTLQ